MQSLSKIFLMVCVLSALVLRASIAVAAIPSSTQPSLLGVKCIAEDAPHSAFTSLVRFNDQWICAFRQASAHKGGTRDSRIRVLSSPDGDAWQTVTTLSDPRGDIRDAKLAVMPDGRLMLLTAIQLFDTSKQNHQSIAWFTNDLKKWDGPIDVGEPDVWMWGICWHKQIGYSVGYHTGAIHFVRLYKTTDGKTFETLVDRLDVKAPFPNETAMTFAPDNTGILLIRCEGEPACLATAQPPYKDWNIARTNLRIGGPALTFAPSGQLLGGGRIYEPEQHTALFWIDPKTDQLTECLKLPSGGDTSYPGLAWQGDVLNMTYYSSHTGKAKIYWANIRFGQAEGTHAQQP
jgi:hypothetical protein